MSGRDWQAFDAELRARAQELAVEILGKPSVRAGQEWRWGTKGSLAVVIAGPKAGMWFDHEAGIGGGLVDLVCRLRGLNRQEALHWIGDRIGMAGDFGVHPRIAKRATRPAADGAFRPRGASVAAEPVSAASGVPEPDAATPGRPKRRSCTSMLRFAPNWCSLICR
jgi:putative DNA primase/helicase